MRFVLVHMLSLALISSAALPVAASEQAPWGRTQAAPEVEHAPQKVVYDAFLGSDEAMTSLLDRVSFLNQLYGADPFESSIIVVIHGEAIDHFAVKNLADSRAHMERAQSLSESGPIEFRMCQAAARMQGYEPTDFHGFVKMVPMADAEIIRLQNEEDHAYMQ